MCLGVVNSQAPDVLIRRSLSLSLQQLAGRLLALKELPWRRTLMVL